jgi:hypothetical protein
LRAFILLFVASDAILENISFDDFAKISATSISSNPYLRSGLSEPYFSIAS